MEQLREEYHKLMLKLETLQKTHSTELEYIREEHEIKEREFKQSLAKLRDDTKSREALKNEKIQGLTEELQTLREEHDKALNTIEKLKTQVEILKNAKSSGGCGSYSDYEGLKETNRMLKSQLVEKDELLSVQTEKIRGLNEEVHECRELIVRLNEEVEGKEGMVKELNERVKVVEREKEEDCGSLQIEVNCLREEVRKLSGGGGGGDAGDRERASVDDENGGGGRTTKRGNSLFSEVEERRLKVESELVRLRALVKKLTEDKRVLQHELHRGDTHTAVITSQLEAISNSEAELSREIKKDKSESLQLFDSYRDRLDLLRSEYNRKLQEYKKDPNASAHPSELETLRFERDKLQFNKLTLEREINELSRELKYNKHLRTAAEANLKIARAKLEYANNHNNKTNNNVSENVADETNPAAAASGTPPPPQQLQNESMSRLQAKAPQTQECNQQ